MAEPYLERLSLIAGHIELNRIQGVNLESKHFFSGAALYANDKICASLSPTGLALKLPAEMRQRLLEEDKGSEFRFFAKGPIKRGYVNLSQSIIQDEKALQELIIASINYVLGRPGSDAA